MFMTMDQCPTFTQFVLAVIGVGTIGSTTFCMAQTPSQWPIHDMNRPHPPVVTPGNQQLPVAPPSDAIVLFDGKDLSQWSDTQGRPSKWKIENDYMESVKGSGYIQTRQGFGDVQLHVEWATPVPVEGEGQGRGNSGVFLMGRYEVQVLDSYENDTYADGQAAAIYGQYPPLVNACRPPGEWQTYDIVFRRPRFREDGALAKPARITVFHNGILVQDNVELWGPTEWLQYLPYEAHPDRLPLAFQDHGNPVRFRNIWVRELPEPVEAGPPAMVSEKVITLAPKVLDRYAGKYERSGGGVFSIEREGDRLFLALSRSRKLELVAFSKTKFSLKRTAGVLDFDLDSAGVPEGFTFHLGGSEYPAKRVEK